MSNGRPLPQTEKDDNLIEMPSEFAHMEQRELEHLHMTLLKAVQQIRRHLGLPPLITGHQERHQKVSASSVRQGGGTDIGAEQKPK